MIAVPGCARATPRLIAVTSGETQLGGRVGCKESSVEPPHSAPECGGSTPLFFGGPHCRFPLLRYSLEWTIEKMMLVRAVSRSLGMEAR